MEMQNELLTKEDYIKILQKKFNNKEIEFKNADILPIADNLQGYVARCFELKLKYKNGQMEETETFFLKTLPTKMENEVKKIFTYKAFEKEIFFYDFLLNEFEKMGYNTSFAPRSYCCKNPETIVLQDMKTKDFKICDSNIFFDLDYCKMSLKALACFHANSISYEEAKSKELGKIYRIDQEYPKVFNKNVYDIDSNDGIGKRYFNCATNCFVNLVKLVPQSEEWKSSFEKRMRKFESSEIRWKKLPYRTTCTHGDLWSNNMFFKYNNGIPEKCCIIDYQFIRQYDPVYDVILLLYSNTRRDFRKKHLDDLLQYYYNTFEDIVKENGFVAKDILPWEEFLAAREALEPMAVMQGASARLPKLLSMNAIKPAGNFEGDNMASLFSPDRPQLLLEACEKNAMSRSIMIDDIYDLNMHI